MDATPLGLYQNFEKTIYSDLLCDTETFSTFSSLAEISTCQASMYVTCHCPSNHIFRSISVIFWFLKKIEKSNLADLRGQS